MVSKVFTVVLACIVGVALADLVGDRKGTSALTSAGVKAETVSMNALLGK